METELSDNVYGLVWDKLLQNVGINALTGITKLLNGELLEHPGNCRVAGRCRVRGKRGCIGPGNQIGFSRSRGSYEGRL